MNTYAPSVTDRYINVGPGEWGEAGAIAWGLVARCGGEPPYTVQMQSIPDPLDMTVIIYLARHLRTLLTSVATAEQIDADYFISEYAALCIEGERQNAQAPTRLRLVTPDPDEAS